MKKLMFLMMLFGLMIIVSDSASAQDICTKELGDKLISFEILNATEKPFIVNFVDGNCKEGRSNQQIPSGQKFLGKAYYGHAFRVREAGTNKLIETVVVNPAKTLTKVGNVTAQTVKIGPKPTLFELVKDPNPMQGFLKTANAVRKARNLPPMQFNNSLNQACKYLTDVSAKHNQMGHDPSKFANLNPQQRAEYTQMSDQVKSPFKF